MTRGLPSSASYMSDSMPFSRQRYWSLWSLVRCLLEKHSSRLAITIETGSVANTCDPKTLQLSGLKVSEMKRECKGKVLEHRKHLKAHLQEAILHDFKSTFSRPATMMPTHAQFSQTLWKNVFCMCVCACIARGSLLCEDFFCVRA